MRPPVPTSLYKIALKTAKREDDGREGAISGRLARKATGVSPSGFARTGVLAGKKLVDFPGHYSSSDFPRMHCVRPYRRTFTRFWGFSRVFNEIVTKAHFWV